MSDGLKELGKNASKLVLNTSNTSLELANKGVETVGVVTNAGLDAAGKITTSGLQTTANVVEQAGKITTSGLITTAGVTDSAGKMLLSGVNVAASTTAIIENITKNFETISRHSTKRQEELEQIKDKAVENLKKLKDVENTTETELKIASLVADEKNKKQKILDNAELAKQKILDDAELAKQQQIAIAEKAIQDLEIENEQNKINSQFDRELSRVENIQNEKNFKQSLMYGFETNKEPYKVGSTLYEEVGNKKYFKYFFPIGVIHPKTGVFFAIFLPESDSPRINDELICKDKDGNVVKITFENVVKKRIFRGPTTKIEPFVTVTKLNPVSNNSETQLVPGKLLFGVKTYFKYKQPVRQGGKSRRQIKKHRVGYKKTKKHKNTKTRNKRRTNYKA